MRRNCWRPGFSASAFSSLTKFHLLGGASWAWFPIVWKPRVRLLIREGTSDQPGGRNSAASSLIGGIGFGGCAVLLSGDFAQIPPVLATSLLDTRTADASTCPNARWQNAGSRAFVALSQNVFKLRRIHRNDNVCDYKTSLLALREAAPSVAQYNL